MYVIKSSTFGNYSRVYDCPFDTLLLVVGDALKFELLDPLVKIVCEYVVFYQ